MDDNVDQTQNEDLEDEVIGGKLPSSSNADNKNQIITMLLTDALNGWKW